MIKSNQTNCEENSQELFLNELEYIKEDILGLSVDIIDLNTEQSELSENVDRLIGVMDKSADIHRNTIDTLRIHQKEISALSESLEETDKVWGWILAILIWQIILTCGVVYNVFF